ncbi:tautomerase family protein [Rhizobiaceae bacterium BDR2-2]|uniref:Tautomerase family protein n=1 Tax=Ectorhizobium quercum TaxID=2965071 RepID=A0AAE3N087_9HYPH|nr:tautomerase family protein [Ectorhizobium quercum]MCX8996452.1 tautomerase family protein [Ectorhizobium quercum]
MINDHRRVNRTPMEKAMPFVHIRIAGKRLPESNLNLLQDETTRLMESVLAKKRELTAVLVEQLPAGGWAVGGQAVPAAAHLEATITAGTSTREEKARFIDKATALLKSVCGTPLPLATYVVVRELPSESWGYDGRTQASRRPMTAPAT